MKNVLRICAALALACVAAPAFAIDTTTGSYVDLAPILNPLLQVAQAFVAAAATVLVGQGIAWMRKKLNIAQSDQDAALQAKVNGVAQTIIGGLFAKANVPVGQITINAHSTLIAEAANKLAASAGESIKALGAPDVQARALDMIVNRIGLMQAAAQGTPVPNPSQPPAAVVAPVVVAPPK